MSELEGSKWNNCLIMYSFSAHHLTISIYYNSSIRKYTPGILLIYTYYHPSQEKKKEKKGRNRIVGRYLGRDGTREGSKACQIWKWIFKEIHLGYPEPRASLAFQNSVG